MFVREFKKSNCSSEAYPEQSFDSMNLIFLDPLIFYVSRNRFVNLFSVFPNLFVRVRTTVRASLAIIWFSTQVNNRICTVAQPICDTKEAKVCRTSRTWCRLFVFNF